LTNTISDIIGLCNTILWTLTKRKLSIYVHYNSWTYDHYVLAIWWGIGIRCSSWVARGLVGVFSILILIIVGWIPMFVGIFFTCFLLYQFDSLAYFLRVFYYTSLIHVAISFLFPLGQIHSFPVISLCTTTTPWREVRKQEWMPLHWVPV
jgi:hypothetical protein